MWILAAVTPLGTEFQYRLLHCRSTPGHKRHDQEADRAPGSDQTSPRKQSTQPEGGSAIWDTCDSSTPKVSLALGIAAAVNLRKNFWQKAARLRAPTASAAL
jgi:hypothetical protein